MRVIKCGLNSVARGDASKAFFRDVVRRAHDAKTAAHLLCKAWILERHQNGRSLPEGKGALVSLFADAVYAVGGNASSTRRARLVALRDAIFPVGFEVDCQRFFNWHVQMGKAYAAQVIEHLSRCYPQCLERYIASRLGLGGREHRQERMAIVRAVMRKEATPRVPAAEALLLVPARALQKGYAMYDIKIKDTALDYLPCMLHMAAHLEREGQRGYAVLPLVSLQVPASVFIDTDTLLYLLPEELLPPGRTKDSYLQAWRTPNPRGGPGRPRESDFDDDDWASKQERLYQGQARLWDLVLDLSKLPVRGSSLRFDNRIQTDGVSIAVYAEHRHEQRAKGKAEYAAYPDERYAHHIDDRAERAELQGRRTLVAIDPGKQNIIFATDAASVRRVGPQNRLEATTLRYTAKQREAETRQRRARAHAAAFRAIAPLAQGHSIDEWEAWLSKQPSGRTLDPAAFRAHILAFYAYADATRDFWDERFHREQRLDAHRRKQRSEARLVNAFKAKFGKPQDVVIAFGDGARNNLCGRAPGPSTAIRRLLQRSHYDVLDVHEPYTSKRCFACRRPDAENGPCRLDKAKGRDAWGVRRCCRCGTAWARDFHACLNIDRLAREHLAGLERPDYLTAGAAGG